MEVREGQYYYAPHRRSWGVWKKGATINGYTMDAFVTDFATKERARTYVYNMNGWKLEK